MKEPKKEIRVIKAFGKLEGSIFDEQQYNMLEYGDLILVQLDQAQPEVRRFTGWGLRSPLISTKYLGFNYGYFFVDGSHPKNPQTKYHWYSVDKSRFRGWAPLE
jgi:hypothetical protein